MSLFSPDSFLMRFLNTVANLIILHFLWIIFSLPLFSIGASTTALYYSCMKLIKNDEGYVFSNFYKSFKENFKQATVIWLFMLFAGIILFIDFRFCIYLNNTAGHIMLILCSIPLIPLLMTSIYIFPVLATFENRIIDNIKNAFIMSFSNFLLSMILIFIIGSIVFLTVFFRPFMGLMLIVGVGMTGYLTANIFTVVFKKYCPDETKAEVTAEI